MMGETGAVYAFKFIITACQLFIGSWENNAATILKIRILNIPKC